PPRALTHASPCPWLDHSASGLGHATHIALFGLAFATTTPQPVNLATHRSLADSFFKRHALTAATAALTDCQHMVTGTFSLHYLGTFPHSLTVLSAIGHQEVFSLTRWSWQIHTKFHEFRATRAHAHCDHAHVSPTGLSPTPVLFPTRFDYTNTTTDQSC